MMLVSGSLEVYAYVADLFKPQPMNKTFWSGPGARARGPLPPNLGSGGLGTMGAESGVS